MRISSVNWEKEITQEQLVEILRRTDRSPFTLRQLTELRQKGLLPTLQRRSCPGSNSPVFVWDKSVIEQAIFLCDLFVCSKNYRWMILPLWLQGYAVDFSSVRQQWLQSMDAYLQTFIYSDAEESYPGDGPEDHISRTVSRFKTRWKHTPAAYRPQGLQQCGMEGYIQLTEILWDVLLVADYEIDETTFVIASMMLQGNTVSGDGDVLQEEFISSGVSWAKTLQGILTVPRLREAIELATPDAWEKARLDYITLCQLSRRVFATTFQEDPEHVRSFLFAFGGFYLVPVALAIRQRGYGHWIDNAFAWMKKELADPATQAWLERMADPEIQALFATPGELIQFLEQHPELR